MVKHKWLTKPTTNHIPKLPSSRCRRGQPSDNCRRSFLFFIDMANALIDNSEQFKLVKYIKELVSQPDCNHIMIATGYWDLPGTSLVHEELEAGNEPIISIMSMRLPTKITIGKIHDGKQITHVDSVEKKIIDVDNIGICISPEIELLLKIKQQKLLVTDLAKVENPFSTSEAYELIPIIRENPTATNYRLINTGTIDPYVNYWGHTKTAYLKNKYDNPQIDVDEFTEKFPKRVRQTIAPKIIISGMRHFESYFDSMGKYVAGKSTIIVLEPSKKNNLVILQGIFNSKLMKFYIYQSFSTLGIGGGINFSKDMVASLPIPKNFEDKALISAVYDVISAFKASSETQISTLLNQIDHIVYHLYGLTYDEVLIIDPQPPFNCEEYESFDFDTYGQS